MEAATEDSLLEEPSAQLAGVVDFLGRPVLRSSSGGWSAALFVIALEIAERFSYYGISSNLITYLTGPLGHSTASAAAAVNAWTGTASLLPLVGAFLADSYLGRYRTILISSLLYVLGYAMLTMSTVLPGLRPPTCEAIPANPANCYPSQFQVFFFYISLYIVALAQGGDKPCGAAFGADQFDDNDLEESASRSSFFNWWYFSMAVGISIAVVVLSYIQDSIGWNLGFGIPCIIMIISFSVFMIGSKNYRMYLPHGESPFIRLGKSFIYFAGNRSWRISLDGSMGEKNHPRHMKLDDAREHARQVDEAKGTLQLLPIWLSSLLYGVVFAQITTLFNKQGRTLDRRITSDFQLPSAALQSFGTMAIICFVPIYDKIIKPAMQNITRNPSGFTMLQRIGTGMAISIITILLAALVEMQRLKTAREHGLVDQPNATIPMSFWWMAPQYVLIGIADVFTLVGLQEFFYDQMPDGLRSLGLALYLSILGMGAFISSFLISVIDKATRSGGDSWFSDNLNRAHLDYFYWLLVGLSILEFLVFLHFAKSYVYKKKNPA